MTETLFSIAKCTNFRKTLQLLVCPMMISYGWSQTTTNNCINVIEVPADRVSCDSIPAEVIYISREFSETPNKEALEAHFLIHSLKSYWLKLKNKNESKIIHLKTNYSANNVKSIIERSFNASLPNVLNEKLL
jgi:hypothetical protein